MRSACLALGRRDFLEKKRKTKTVCKPRPTELLSSMQVVMSAILPVRQHRSPSALLIHLAYIAPCYKSFDNTSKTTDEEVIAYKLYKHRSIRRLAPCNQSFL